MLGLGANHLPLALCETESIAAVDYQLVSLAPGKQKNTDLQSFAEADTRPFRFKLLFGGAVPPGLWPSFDRTTTSQHQEIFTTRLLGVARSLTRPSYKTRESASLLIRLLWEETLQKFTRFDEVLILPRLKS